MASGVDLSVELAGLSLKNPVVAASGTFGTGLEMTSYVDPASLGAVTVKSLSANPWAGNASPRLTPTPAGMLNSVGLQNPGVKQWMASILPGLRDAGATVIASIWGRSIDEFAEAARLMSLADGVAALEINLSCPNLESSSEMFAHSAAATSGVVDAVAREFSGSGRPIIAKLSPNTIELIRIAQAAVEAGAAALTLVNTVIGMRIDPETRRPKLARSPSGLSGPAIRPIAVKCVYEVATALPGVPIIGTGGVSDGSSAIEMMLAGANCVGVGTATFYDPRATTKIVDAIRRWCASHDIDRVAELTGKREITSPSGS